LEKLKSKNEKCGKVDFDENRLDEKFKFVFRILVTLLNRLVFLAKNMSKIHGG